MTRVARRLGLVVATACALGGLLYLAHALLGRPFGRVEAELVFQASRLQRGLPLYVDPAVGAWDMGAPPSRYYVLYTPLWPWVLAHLAPPTLGALRTVGRAINGVLFLGTLAALVGGSRSERRAAVGMGALLALGLGMLSREAATADADVAAVALSTLGLLRAARRRGLDATSGALLAAAPLVKPSVLGVAVGAFALHLIAGRKQGRRGLLAPLIAGAAVAGALVGLFHLWSHGEWLTHIVRATGQRLSLDRWAEETGARLVFLGLPHLAAGVFAVRRGASRYATVPLFTSVAWATFSMAKHGSGTQYWLEPTMAALVALGQCPVATGAPEERVWTLAGLALAVGVAVTSLPALAGAVREDARWSAVVEGLRAHCTLAPGQVIVSSDSTLELQLDGRVIVPCWQTSYLVRSGQFPLEAWRRDVAAADGPRWFVTAMDFRDEPTPQVLAGATEVCAYRKELRDVIEEHFEYDGEVDGMLVYRRR